MKKEKRQARRAGGFLLLTLFMVLLSTRNGFSRVEIYPDIKLKSEFKKSEGANRETIESLLAEIWSSGFLRRSERMSEEIQNNEYGIFSEQNEWGGLLRGRACYLKDKTNQDLIMFDRSLFPHLERDLPGVAKRRSLDKGIKATLVHELFHDFWLHILDTQKRSLFTAEAEMLFHKMIMVKTKEEKLGFLREVGYSNPSEKDFEAFRKLLALRKTYPDYLFLNYEFYSLLADRCFSKLIVIPTQLRKFYADILAEEVLNRESVSAHTHA